MEPPEESRPREGEMTLVERKGYYDEILAALASDGGRWGYPGFIDRACGKEGAVAAYLAPWSSADPASRDLLHRLAALDGTLGHLWKVAFDKRITCLHMPLLPTFYDAVCTKMALESDMDALGLIEY